MPLQRYGVLRGQVVRYTPGTEYSPHFRIILVEANNTEYQVDVNVRSRDGSEVLYHANEDFQLSGVTHGLLTRRPGITPLTSTPDSGALDYLREPLFDTADMVPLPVSGWAHDDLNSHVGTVVESARVSGGVVFAFGQYFQDSGRLSDRDSREGLPSHGIHDIHMNQGNARPYHRDNGTFQDGALLIYFPTTRKWVATFLAFQTQSFHTDAGGNPAGPSWEQVHGGREMDGR